MTLDRSATVYVSTPITTGRAYYEARTRLGATLESEGALDAAARRLAMDENRSAAETTLARARDAGLGRNHINPTLLVVEHWTQQQYLEFWLAVIDRWVGTVVLASGWEFSDGSAQEVVHSFRAGLPVFDSDLAPLSPAAAQVRIEFARSELDRLGFSPGVLSAAVADLAALIGTGEQRW